MGCGKSRYVPHHACYQTTSNSSCIPVYGFLARVRSLITHPFELFSPHCCSDQFCSLHYSFANLFFVGCYYTRYFANSPMPTMQTSVNPESSLYIPSPINLTTRYEPELYSATSAFYSLNSGAGDLHSQEAWSACGATRNWGWYYVLGTLPFLVRFVQSLRRYWDSKLHTHLINVRNPHNLQSFLCLLAR